MSITNLQDVGDELLIVDTSGTGIVSTYDPMSGILTLSATDTPANYEMVLRTIQYDNTAALPDATTRVVEFQIAGSADPGSMASALVTIDVNVPPSIDLDPDTTGDYNVTYVVGGDAVQLEDVAATITDSDSNVDILTVTITNIQNPGQEILLVNPGLIPIVDSYNPSTGVLTLTNSESPANYETVLRTIRYKNLSATPDFTQRVIEFHVGTDMNLDNRIPGGSSSLPPNSNSRALGLTTASITPISVRLWAGCITPS